MEDLVNAVNALQSAAAAVQTAVGALGEPSPVTDPVWDNVKAVLTNAGWQAPTPVVQVDVQTPDEPENPEA